MRFNRKIKYNKIITLTMFIFMLSIFVSNAEILDKLSVNEEIINEIIESEALNVKIIGKFLGKDNFMPGDTINNDKITLVNNENFPVTFTFNLDKQGEDLKDKLKVDIVGAKSILNDNIYESTVKAMDSKDVYSNVSWIDEGAGVEVANKSLNNVYTISSMKNDFIYESYFNSKEEFEDWTLERGVLSNSSEGMIISSKKYNGNEENGKIYLSNIQKSYISKEEALEVNLVLDVSKLISNGRDKDGFDYYITLNDKNKNYALTFAFHICYYDKKLNVYCNNQYGEAPIIEKSSIIPNTNILKFKYKFYNKSGFLEARLSIEDIKGNELYFKVLNKSGQIDERKWSIDNISNIRRVGFSGVRCNSDITIRYIDILTN